MAALILIGLVLAHEAGHGVAAAVLGLRLRAFAARHPARLGVAVVSPTAGLDAGSDLIIALAGPAVSLVVAAVLWPAGLPVYALASAAFGLVSLLPVRPQDGWRARRALAELRRQHVS